MNTLSFFTHAHCSFWKITDPFLTSESADYFMKQIFDDVKLKRIIIQSKQRIGTWCSLDSKCCVTGVSCKCDSSFCFHEQSKDQDSKWNHDANLGQHNRWGKNADKVNIVGFLNVIDKFYAMHKLNQSFKHYWRHKKSRNSCEDSRYFKQAKNIVLWRFIMECSQAKDEVLLIRKKVQF